MLIIRTKLKLFVHSVSKLTNCDNILNSVFASGEVYNKCLNEYLGSSEHKERMITLPFHFDFPAIKMKGGRFEGPIRKKIKYEEKEDVGLFKQ